MRGDTDRAIADFDAAVKLDPNDAIAVNNRGLRHRNKGDADRAIADFSAAIKLKPDYVNALYNRGTAYFDAARSRPRDRRLQRGDQARRQVRGCL